MEPAPIGGRVRLEAPTRVSLTVRLARVRPTMNKVNHNNLKDKI